MRPSVLRIGVVGLGIGSVLSLPELARHERVKLAAAADTRPEALEQFAREFGGRTFRSVEDLCASSEVDVVYVCTPSFLHAEHAVIAAEHRKHVLVEKPMALTLEACDAMIAAAERQGVYLMSGHSHSFDPPIRAMRELVRTGSLGRLVMLHTWNYTDVLYRPRAAWEMDTARGGGVVWIQAPHQVEVLRLIGGGLVRSVRAMTGTWDAARPTEGNYVAYLEFEDGTPATMVYSGYAHFDSAELHHWVGATGAPRRPDTHARARAAFARRSADAEQAERDARRYGAGPPDERARLEVQQHQPFFGLTLVSCQDGDIRQSPEGLTVYGDEGPREIRLPPGETGRQAMLDELYRAVAEDRPPLHDGRWSKATVEVALAILQSARERREVHLEHQVAVRREQDTPRPGGSGRE